MCSCLPTCRSRLPAERVGFQPERLFFHRHYSADAGCGGGKEAVLRVHSNLTMALAPAKTGGMLLLRDRNTESDGLSHLLETGAEVNIPADTVRQHPAHLAAYGGHAFFLLWQLLTGANLNQQDWLGEAPIHKAAKVGSLECLTLLVASHVTIDLRNKKGQTAEDLALAFGFGECAQFLMTMRETQNRKPIKQVSNSLKRGSN